MPLTSRDIHDALCTVNDPELHKDLVSLNMVKDLRLEGNDVRLVIELTTPACPLKDRIRADIEQAIKLKASERDESPGRVEIEFTADVRGHNQRRRDKESPLPNVAHVIAVGAGKGGVGKSTVATILAVGLSRHGAKVGLLDGDMYGPSMPTLLGLHDRPAEARDERTLVPFEVHGIKAMTIGKLVPPEKALIWRGPMLHKALQQLLLQTQWGDLDYLIVDLPPGTGDIALSLSQMLPLTGAVIVCTPQVVAQDDARRAIRMFQQLGIDVLGVVENMSSFICEHGTTYDIFGRGGAEKMAADMNIEFLGALPLHPKMRVNGDNGRPTDHWSISDDVSTAMDRIVQGLAGRISIASMSGRLTQPTLSIS